MDDHPRPMTTTDDLWTTEERPTTDDPTGEQQAKRPMSPRGPEAETADRRPAVDRPTGTEERRPTSVDDTPAMPDPGAGWGACEA